MVFFWQLPFLWNIIWKKKTKTLIAWTFLICCVNTSLLLEFFFFVFLFVFWLEYRLCFVLFIYLYFLFFSLHGCMPFRMPSFIMIIFVCDHVVASLMLCTFRRFFANYFMFCRRKCVLLCPTRRVCLAGWLPFAFICKLHELLIFLSISIHKNARRQPQQQPSHQKTCCSFISTLGVCSALPVWGLLSSTSMVSNNVSRMLKENSVSCS